MTEERFFGILQELLGGFPLHPDTNVPARLHEMSDRLRERLADEASNEDVRAVVSHPLVPGWALRAIAHELLDRLELVDEENRQLAVEHDMAE